MLLTFHKDHIIIVYFAEAEADVGF